MIFKDMKQPMPQEILSKNGNCPALASGDSFKTEKIEVEFAFDLVSKFDSNKSELQGLTAKSSPPYQI